MKHLPFFTKFGKGLKGNVQHGYAEEMVRKSEVVSIHYSFN